MHWVVGARGLLGQAVGRALSVARVPVHRSRVPWTDPAGAVDALANDLMDRFASWQKRSPEDQDCKDWDKPTKNEIGQAALTADEWARANASHA